jgi:S-adenosylmethionine decarboxylase
VAIAGQGRRAGAGSTGVADGTTGIGPHLMLDRIGMTKVMPPYVFKYSGVRAEDWGLSGFVLIAEGHVSVHTFPEKSFVTADVFSSRAFDSSLVATCLTDAFGILKTESRLLERGTEFPMSIGGASRIARAERRRIARTAPRPA